MIRLFFKTTGRRALRTVYEVEFQFPEDEEAYQVAERELTL